LGVRRFFRDFFPVKKASLIREEVFFLTYGTKGGFTYGDIEAMNPKERSWYVDRLAKQLKDERDALKKGKMKKK
jgi:hypothetical protein